MKIKIINHSDNPLPEYKTTGSSGMDLCAYIDTPILLFPHHTVLVPTGINIELPDGYEAQVRPRSGLSLKGVTAELGTIDSDYQGDIGIILNNRSDHEFRIEHGMRLAQLVITPIVHVELQQVTEFTRNTNRNTQGFGHTGIK